MHQRTIIFLLLLCSSRLLVAQTESITIGTQVWMKRNLNTPKFRNGDPIALGESEADWKKAGVAQRPVGCAYENDPANGKKYGALYNWYAVNDPRGICPAGWHVPSARDWSVLIDFMSVNTGKKMKVQTDFLGLSGGNRNLSGAFESKDAHGYWWSKTEVNSVGARAIFFNNYEWGEQESGNRFNPLDVHKNMGFSVRCIKD